jgi:hypothetical protein
LLFIGFMIRAGVLNNLVAAILVAGTAGEIQALLALDWRRPVGDPHAAIEVAVFLTLVAGLGPMLAVLRSFRPLVVRDVNLLQQLWTRLRRRRTENPCPDPVTESCLWY